MHVCIFRTDRIGDVILTLPAAEAVCRSYPGARITVVAQSYTAPLIARCPSVHGTIEIPGRDIDDPFRFARTLASARCDAAVFAYPRPALALAAAIARIPRRIGTSRRWYSPLFTDRLPQRRREGKDHESRWTIRLLEPLGVEPTDIPHPRIEPRPDDIDAARELAARSGLDPEAPFIALHPGSGGSAHEWGAERFAALGRRMRAERPDLPLLVSAGKGEESLAAGIRDRIGRGAWTLAESAPLPVYAALCARAALFVANSTGPLHIAAALGVPALGLYPAAPHMHPRRWGPLGPRTCTLVPEPVPDCPHCAATACERHDQPERILVERVWECARLMLGDRYPGTELL